MSNRITDLAPEGVRTLSPYQPGKPIEALERELGLSDTIKLASNENPLGASPAALTAMKSAVASVSLYPDGNGFTLKEILANRHALPVESITLGNGSNDVLELIARAFLGPGAEAVFSRHAFAIYPIVTQAVGARGACAPAAPPGAATPYGHDLMAMQGLITDATRVVFIANPNNPTGTWLARDELRAFIEALPATTLAVVDEAYFEYVGEPDYPDTSQWLTDQPNLIVTRSFSKIHGLAGVRVGYALSDPAVADLLNRVRQPFNVNSLAQQGALAALQDTQHVERSIAMNHQGLNQLMAACGEYGWPYIPSVANFLTIDVGREAQPVYEALLRQGVIVRPLAGYGLPQHLRVTVGSGEQNQRFIEALARVRGA